MRVAVLASGRGSNLHALLEAEQGAQLGSARIVVVGSDRPDAMALRVAANAGVAAFALRTRDYASRPAFDQALFQRLDQYRPDLIVLAGYMRVISGDALLPWQGRVINIHPSLLPKYPGLETHRRAIEAGDAEHGASVHWVTAELDGGPVIAQVRLPIVAGDTPDLLAARLLPLEHELMVRCVRELSLAAGR